MKEAQERGIKFKAPPLDPDAFKKAWSARDKDGRQYNSRAGIAGYYRYGPRKISDLCDMRVSGRRDDTVLITTPKIHETALLRLRSDSNAYAPIGLPSSYAVVNSDGKIIFPEANPYETKIEADARAQDQERVWNIVWLRRIVYFLTLAASFHLAAFWIFHNQVAAHEFDSPIPLVSQFVRLVESFLPHQVVHWWTDYYATNPAAFIIGIMALAVLIGFGGKLEGKITDSMRFIWTQRAQKPTIENSSLHTTIRDFRTSPHYQAVLRAARYYILPLLSVVFLVYVGAVALNHLALNIVDPIGVLCRGTDPSQLERLTDSNKNSTKEIIFPTNNICFATGVYLTRGAKYLVAITPDGPSSDKWSDGDLPETTLWAFAAPMCRSGSARSCMQECRCAASTSGAGSQLLHGLARSAWMRTILTQARTRPIRPNNTVAKQVGLSVMGSCSFTSMTQSSLSRDYSAYSMTTIMVRPISGRIENEGCGCS